MNRTRHIFRVDRFHVPEAAQQEFLAKVKEIHGLLRGLPGFIEDRVLRQTYGPGRFNFVTIVVWETAKAGAAAKEKITSRFRSTGFNPQDLFSKLQIEADIGTYEDVV